MEGWVDGVSGLGYTALFGKAAVAGRLAVGPPGVDDLGPVCLSVFCEAVEVRAREAPSCGVHVDQVVPGGCGASLAPVSGSVFLERRCWSAVGREPAQVPVNDPKMVQK